jgi:hypothetical protein
MKFTIMVPGLEPLNNAITSLVDAVKANTAVQHLVLEEMRQKNKSDRHIVISDSGVGELERYTKAKSAATT